MRSRIPKTTRVARTRADGRWTEAGYFGFLRSGFRMMSMRWPPLSSVLTRVRRKYTGDNKRQKWEYQCEDCWDWFSKKEIHVDHIIPCGQLKSEDDIQRFVVRLFCEGSGLQVLCSTCHRNKHNESEN